MTDGKQLDPLMDDKGNWVHPKVLSALSEIFARFETTAGAGWTEFDLQSSATVCNGRLFHEAELQQVKVAFAPLNAAGNITLEGFVKFYRDQTRDHPNETWKDLRKFGYNSELDLIASPPPGARSSASAAAVAAPADAKPGQGTVQATATASTAAAAASASGTGAGSGSGSGSAAGAGAGTGGAAAASGSAGSAGAAGAGGSSAGESKGDGKSAGAAGSAAAAPGERPGFKLILVDMQKPLCEHFARMFRQEGKGKDAPLDPNVSVVCGRFEHLKEFDCMVSAANSFGLMDGGVDGAITMFFGDQLQKRVQKHIVDHFDGEQPVGTSFIIPTNNEKHPWLAHTPTMRVPYSIQGLDNVYLAMKAMLRAVYDHNQRQSDPSKRIKSVACTGFGTYYGKMELEEAARQMHLAWRGFVKPPKEISWDFAGDRQEAVRYGGFHEVLRFAQDLQKQKAREAEAYKSRMEISGNMNAFAMLTKGLNRGNNTDL